MIGKDVVMEAIEDTSINEVVLINRSPIDIRHPKIKEIITSRFATSFCHQRSTWTTRCMLSLYGCVCDGHE